GRLAQDRGRVAHAGVDEVGRAVLAGGQQLLGVGHYQGGVVDVDGPRVRRDLVRRLVRVDRRRQAGPDVKELPHSGRARQVADDAPEEGAVGPGDVHDARVDGAELVAGRLVDRVVVGAAQPVVPDTGGVRYRGVYSCIVSGHGKSLHELVVKENFRYAAYDITVSACGRGMRASLPG